MRSICVDLEAGEVRVEWRGGGGETWPLASAEAFERVSAAWLRAGWDAKHVYSFTWMGRPVIQLPEDLLRMQEVIWRLQPEVIIETGVAHGGSLVFYASLLRAIGRGRVIGVEVALRAPNRAALQAHPLADLIELVDGSSIDPQVVEAVAALIEPGDRSLVVLDAKHTKAHVLAELRAYERFVAPGGYLVACDGIMADLAGAPRSRPEWGWDNPKEAVRCFLAERSDFTLAPPPFEFNEGLVRRPVTYWPDAWLRRLR